MNGVWQDARLALRLLAKDCRFTIAAVLALGLGIGLNTSVFAIINASFLRDVPLPEPARLTAIQFRDARQALPGRDIGGLGAGNTVVALSYHDLLDLRQQTTSFEGLAANAPVVLNVSDDGHAAERFRGSYLAANTFRVLRVAPILGRDFQDEDDQLGAPTVVMLGHYVWHSRYGGDPSVVGRSLRINDVPATIIGVMPEGFNYPAVDRMWLPLSAIPNLAKATRATRNLSVTGRLKPGVDLATARAELDTVVGRLAQTYPDTHKNLASFARPLRELYPTPPITMITLMMGAVAFVLLIAYANLANLLLARSVHRAREFAIRTALGATRGRVIRQQLIECGIIAVAGGVIGLGLSVFGVREIALAFEPIEAGSQLGTNRPFWVNLNPNAALYGFVGLLSLASAFAFGLLPAWHTSRTDINATLKDAGRPGGGGVRHRRWASALLTGELALVIVLLSAAGFQVHGFLDRYWEDPIIETAGVVTMRLGLPVQKYSTGPERKAFLQQLDQRLRSVSEFSAVTMASHVPLEFGAPTRPLFVDGVTWPAGEKPPVVSYLLTGAGYFETLRIPIVRGRSIQAGDGRVGSEGAVIDERFATRFFPNADPVGQRIRMGTAGPWFTIVGVARALPFQGPTPELRPLVYASLEAEPAPEGRAAIIVKGPLREVTRRLREEVAALDPRLPLFGIETLDQTWARGRTPVRVMSTWFGTLAIVALVLAAVGVFAITAHNVAQRTHEVGVRMALGADAREVVRLFMRRTLMQLIVGSVIGLAGAVAVGRVIGTALEVPGERDYVTFTVVTVLLGAVALISTLVPARRAARVDPAVTLRT